MEKINREVLEKLAKSFIKDCNAIPFVHATEGGVLDLETLLPDFIKYIELRRTRSCIDGEDVINVLDGKQYKFKKGQDEDECHIPLELIKK